MGSWISRPVHERIILVGPSGSGKDHDARVLADLGYTIGVSHTTRPPRDGEVDGRDYYFVDEDTFDKVDFYETSSFGIHRYGLSVKEWNTKQVFVFNPEGIANVVANNDRDTAFVIYLDIPENVRNVRLASQRGWSDDEISTRAEVDTRVFATFKDYNLQVTEPLHSIDAVVCDLISPHQK